MSRIPSLDGLRALSIALVVVGHWIEMRYQSDVAGAFANLGVRIFFVVSGYLITKLLLTEESATGTVKLRAFYVRRAFRILPAATFYMLPVFLIFRHELRWYHAAAAVLYLANFDPAHPWFLGHLWSLSVEEQFYLLWPGALKRWAETRQRVGVLMGVVGVAPIFRIGCHVLGLHGRADETFPAVADVLAVGCLLAILEPQLAARVQTIKSWIALPMILFPMALVPTYTGLVKFHLTLPLLFVLWPALHSAIAILVLRVVQRPYPILNAKPVAWLGRISYSLYLWQQLFVFGHNKPWYGAIYAVGVASLSYYLIERPALRLRALRSSRAQQKHHRWWGGPSADHARSNAA
jgi:peptidoglycan/LPS O-acetylase OafA/YrhL